MSIELILLLLSILHVKSKRLDKDKVVYAVNCGGKQVKSQDGYIYQADTEHPGTEISDWNNELNTGNDKVIYTYDPEIFFKERWSRESFFYSLPVEKEGNYVIILQFTEVAFRDPGKRVYKVTLGDCVIQDKLDVFKISGGHAKALNLYQQVKVENGKAYNYEGKQCIGSVGKNLVISFIHLGIDNPMISAIVLVKGTLEDTDYYRQGEIKKEFDRMIELEQRKKEFEKKYQVYNKYAKLKKRKRNYFVDKSHHYDVILEEETTGQSRGFLRPILMVIALSAIVILILQVKDRIEENKWMNVHVLKNEGGNNNGGNIQGKQRLVKVPSQQKKK